MVPGNGVVTVNSANDVYEGGSVLVREDRIADIGSKAELTSKNPDAEVIDSSQLTVEGVVEKALRTLAAKGFERRLRE